MIAPPGAWAGYGARMPSPVTGPADEPTEPDGGDGGDGREGRDASDAPDAPRAARRRIAVVWTALCLAGLGATFALGGGGEAVVPTDRERPPPPVPSAPAPTPTEINCEWVADEIEWTRAEWARRTHPPGLQTIVRDYSVPEECGPTLERRGLR